MKRKQKTRHILKPDPSRRRLEDLDQPTIPSSGLQMETPLVRPRIGKRIHSEDRKSSEVQNKRRNFGQKGFHEVGHRKRKRDDLQCGPSAAEEQPAKKGRMASVLVEVGMLLNTIYYGLFPLRRKRSVQSSSSPPNKRMKIAEDEVSEVVREVVDEVISDKVGGIESNIKSEASKNIKRVISDVVEVISEALPSTSTGHDAPAAFKLSDFIFHKILGQGSYGKVALASHVASGKLVAVKVVKKRQLIEEVPTSVLTEKLILEEAEKSPFCTRSYGTFQTEGNSLINSSDRPGLSTASQQSMKPSS